MRFNRLLIAAAAAVTLGMGAAQAQVSVMLPANPGGGWDSTGRSAFAAMNEAGIYTGGINFTNTGGAGGTIGLAEFQNRETGKADALAVFGAITVGSIILNNSPIDLTSYRPIARLTAEHLVVAVAKDSPHKTLADLVKAMKADPGGTPVGGGSAGGVDHIALALLAQAAGIPVADLNYIPQASGAETVTAIINGTAKAGISGISEFQQFADQGRIRILGITSAERMKGLDVPTFKEQGFDVEIANWRGILGAPKMPEDNYKLWVERFTKLNDSPAWDKVLADKGWEKYFLAGDEFGAFIKSENERIGKILKEAGLAK